jgi:hypothetical protein
MEKERTMVQSQTDILEQRVSEEATRLREAANLLPPGALREHVLRKAQQAETGARVTEWLRSPACSRNRVP